MNEHESYVSIGTAKLLKKAGFNWECSGHWVETNKDNKDALLVLPHKPRLYGLTIVDIELSSYTGCIKDWNAVEDGIGFQFYYSAPTLAVVQKWLLEVKGIFVNATNYRLEGSSNYTMWRWYYHSNDSELFDSDFSFKSYDEALGEGIKKCLGVLLKKQ